MTAKDEGGGGGCFTEECYKKVLCFFNVIFLMSGLGLGALALWTYLGQHGAFIVVIPSYTYQLIVVLTLATACLILINALIGLVGVKLQWKCIIYLYTIFLIVIWMSELLVGMLSYSYIQDVRSDLAQSLAKSFQAFYHMDSEFTQSVDLIQSKLRCCGAKSPEDWNSSQWRLKVWSETIEAVPASCCKTNTTSQCGLRIHPSSIAFTGCVHPISHHIQRRLLVFASGSLGFSILQVFGILLSLCYACKVFGNKAKKYQSIKKQELDSSRFTRNQLQFNYLNDTMETSVPSINGTAK